MLLRRVMEFLPLALVLGTSLAALRHEELAEIRRAALRTTGKIVAGIVLGCGVLQLLLLFTQD